MFMLRRPLHTLIFLSPFLSHYRSLPFLSLSLCYFSLFLSFCSHLFLPLCLTLLSHSFYFTLILPLFLTIPLSHFSSLFLAHGLRVLFSLLTIYHVPLACLSLQILLISSSHCSSLFLCVYVTPILSSLSLQSLSTVSLCLCISPSLSISLLSLSLSLPIPSSHLLSISLHLPFSLSFCLSCLYLCHYPPSLSLSPVSVSLSKHALFATAPQLPISRQTEMDMSAMLSAATGHLRQWSI